jgi:DNA-binding response OmpR family regulator
VALGIKAKHALFSYQMSSRARVLLVETRRRTAVSFASPLEENGFQIAIAYSVSSAVERASEFAPDLTIIDAASMKAKGVRMCRKLREAVDGGKIILVVSDDKRSDLACGADVILGQPFTPRKLLNAIRCLLPTTEGEWLVRGQIELNVSERRVRCQGREGGLTPKTTKLLRLLMTRAGRVVTRRELIKRVWDTDYLGDTRTLDVHINWLRRAIEEDPGRPKLLKTVRRKGYCLEVPPSKSH